MRKLIWGFVVVLLVIAGATVAQAETKTGVTVELNSDQFVGASVQGLGTGNEVSLLGKVGSWRPAGYNKVYTYFAFGANKRIVHGLFLGVYSAFASYENELVGDLGFEATYALPLNDWDLNGLVFSLGYDDFAKATIGIGGYW